MSLLRSLAPTSLVRRAADELFQEYARRRVARLDALPAARVQRNTLFKLIQQARGTEFGRRHRFDEIRTVEDYQRLVPLRTYEEFWTEWWSRDFPMIAGTTITEQVPYFALSSGTTTGATKYIPVSRRMLASNRKAALTTLAFHRNAHPDSAIFTGRIFFLGGSTSLTPLRRDPPIKAGDLSGIAAVEVSSIIRQGTFPPVELGLMSDWDQKVERLAEQSARLRITALSGVPAWMLVLFDRLKRVTGKKRIVDIWPELTLVIHGGTAFDAYEPLFRRELGDDGIHLLETYPCSEGFVAAEDPRHGLLRLIPDHGIFFEFIPVAELDQPRPTRCTLANLEPGVQYAVVLTTCAGLWSCLLGDTVRFESRRPPLLRFTGRTRHYLSAFGEHLIGEEVEKALAAAVRSTGAELADFHVGPVFPEHSSQPGRHRYLVEFVRRPADLDGFAAIVDGELSRLNADYAAHREGDISLGRPEVVPVRPGGFHAWMRRRGQLGGQHKVPRLDNTGKLTRELEAAGILE